MKNLRQLFDRLEKSNIGIYEYKENKKLCGYELNTYTDAGVNMLVFLDFRDTEKDPKNPQHVLEIYNNRVNSIDVDDELLLHLEDKRYRAEIGAVIGAKDFVDWKRNLQNIFNKKSSRQIQFEQTTDKFKSIISDLEDTLNLMPIKGNTKIDCQRTGIQQAINKLDSYINGIQIKDFEPNEYSGDFKLSYS